MRILVVGPFGSPQRDEAICRGFRECGAEVERCEYGDLLFSRNVLTRVQFRFATGPVCTSLASRVAGMARDFSADVVFFRRPLEFTPSMLRYIRSRTSALLASFNNDDPFSAEYSDRRWRMLRQAIPLFDVHFAFRRRNIAQYAAHGARNVALWEPFYSPWLHRPLDSAAGAQGEAVLFAMHAERDSRRDAVLALRQAGLPVDVYSWNWALVYGSADARAVGSKPAIWGDDYVRAIGDALATLCFFSRQNGDELTSRVFEIPACGGLLAAEKNERIAQLFEPGEEAVLFDGIDDLVAQLRALKEDPARAARMRRAGADRLLAGRHSVVHRCADALEVMRVALAARGEAPAHLMAAS